MRGELQHDVLDMLARGCSVVDAASHICRHAEAMASGVLCSIVTVDRDGLLHPLAGPSIAKAYCDALDGIAIGAGVGSCGTAAFLRRPVAVEDIFTDPYWKPYRALAEILGAEHDVAACWSSPILQSDGRVLGAFGFYYKDKRGPTEEERRLVEECVHLCSLVLEREAVKAENQRLAFFDTLTGLGNRANFIRSLEAMTDRSAGHGNGPFGILLVDIDHLGRINDAFGHAVGDRLIREVAEAAASVAGTSNTFRVDADEFALIIRSGEEQDLAGIAQKILRRLQDRPLAVGDHMPPMSASCGGAICNPFQIPDVASYMQQANLALHHAKQTLRGGFALYSDALAGAIAQRFQVLHTVNSALSDGRVEAHYQPIVRLDTREIVGLEALCRIRMPDGHVLSAGMFQEALQDAALGHVLTERMLEQVALDLRDWITRKAPLHYVSVNVSMSDFDQGNLRERMREIFGRHGIPSDNIVVEVTETVYMDPRDSSVARTIEEMRRDGLRVALDDFGTGYASLTHLLNFPVDIVKIDKTFVDRMCGGPGEVIIKALLDMATGLDMRIIAEGVETADQALRLQRLGCRYAQGYLFGRPADRNATTALLLSATQPKRA